MLQPRFVAVWMVLWAMGSIAAAQDRPGTAQDAPAESPTPGNPETGGGSEAKPESPRWRLETVTVTAERVERSTFDVPQSVTVLGQDTFRDALYRTIPEAFREVPGAHVQKTSHGQGSPFLRGFTGFRTLTLVDGIRLNNSVFRDGPNQYNATIDPYTIGRMEIVKGPSSVLHGSDAVGGTINVLTRAWEFQEEDGLLWSRRTIYRFSSAEDSHTVRAESAGQVNRRLGFLLGGTWRDYDDLRAGGDEGRQANTGYSEWDADAKFQFRARPNLMLTLAHQRVDQDDAARTHATNRGVEWHGTQIGTDAKRDFDQDRRLTWLRADWTEARRFFHTARFTASLHEQAERQTRISSSGRLTIDGFEVDSWGIEGQFVSDTPIGELTYGGSFTLDVVDSFRRDPNAPPSAADPHVRKSPRGPVADDARYELLGIFLQDRFRVTQDWEIVAGVRYDRAEAHANEVGLGDIGPTSLEVLPALDRDWDAWNGSLRTIVGIGDHWKAFAGVGRGFRAPNLSDLTRFDIALSGEVETPSPDLSPEEFTGYDAGIRAQYDFLEGEAAYFYTAIQDLITRFRTGITIPGAGAEVRKNNIGDGYVQGVELSLRAHLLEDWTVWTNATWMESSVEQIDPRHGNVVRRRPLPKSTPANGGIGLRWDHPGGRWWLESWADWSAAKTAYSPFDHLDVQRIPPGGWPGAVTWNLRGAWQTPIEGLRVTLAVENLLDANLREFGSGVNEPGRNFLVELDWKF